MRIAVDFDGTIANTYALQQQFCKVEFGIDLPLEASVGKLREGFLTAAQLQAAKQFVHGPATLDAPLVPGAKEAIAQLAAAGHHIIVLTGRVEAVAKIAKQYLKKHAIPHEQVLFVSDEEKLTLRDGTALTKATVLTRLQCNVMIDDQLKSVSDVAGKVLVILLSQPWNRHERIAPGMVRAKDWHSIAAIITRAKATP